MPYGLMLILHGSEEGFNPNHKIMPHRGKAWICEHIKVTVLTYCPGLGQWLALSPVSAETRDRDTVEAYVNCSSLLWYNLITRVRPCVMN